MKHETTSDQKLINIQSKVFEKLIFHLQKRTDVQNIDLMNLSCLDFVETVFQNGILKPPKTKVLKLITRLQEKKFMECPMKIGKINFRKKLLKIKWINLTKSK